MWENDNLTGLNNLPRVKELTARGRSEVWKWLSISPWHWFWPNVYWDPLNSRVLGLYSRSSSLKLNYHLLERGQGLESFSKPPITSPSVLHPHSLLPNTAPPLPLWQVGGITASVAQLHSGRCSPQSLLRHLLRLPGSSVFWKQLAFWLELEACRCWCLLEGSDLMDLEIFWFI